MRPRRLRELLRTMGRWAAFEALLLCALAVQAEWQHLETQRMGTRFIDPASIQRDGGLVTVSTLVQVHDVKKMLGAKSILLTDEIDCAQRRFRRLNSVSFAGEKAQGEVLSRNAEAGPWEAIGPVGREASQQWLFAAVCGP